MSNYIKKRYIKNIVDTGYTIGMRTVVVSQKLKGSETPSVYEFKCMVDTLVTNHSGYEIAVGALEPEMEIDIISFISGSKIIPNITILRHELEDMPCVVLEIKPHSPEKLYLIETINGEFHRYAEGIRFALEEPSTVGAYIRSLNHVELSGTFLNIDEKKLSLNHLNRNYTAYYIP